ncbi:imidazolonepropionase [Paraneptunicella aestuarii]|uniref:imidazolonepropionase n=1 Tax=Paraneptunicella aestuarii TaxID=2831148 RepID=UPI001E45B44C|nr:imidazolonepropionase [Paraneptunicella aestuarii]UAA38326.1 imidazolonepropionase [Paraneptunicella aestuarii]
MTHQDSTHSAVLLLNANIAPMDSGIAPESFIHNGAVLIENGLISWVGKEDEMPSLPTEEIRKIDFQGQWLMPGFIDCHTHLVFAGNRSNEFEKRLNGISYKEIAEQGGGILSTVNATRAASEDDLYTLAKKRASAMLKNGVTTIEIKSGYGLDYETEKRVLQVAKRLSESLSVNISKTYLGAHAIPPEFKGRADEYIAMVCQEVMPRLAEAGLIDAVDVFCENIGFNLEQTKAVFEQAKALGLAIKGHTEQLSAMGGSELAANMGALSVDHLEYLQESDIKAMSQQGTIATLLPGAFYYLRETQLPPIQLLRQYNVPMAIATDFNPGSSPIASLPLMLNMACTLFGMTVEEALQGVTINAAKALGMENQVGTLEVGKQADIVCWDISHPRDLVYEYGVASPKMVMHKGKVVL